MDDRLIMSDDDVVDDLVDNSQFVDIYTRVIALTGSAIAIAVQEYVNRYLVKEPYNICPLRGILETNRIIKSSHIICRNQIRMDINTFNKLYDMIKDRELLADIVGVSLEEQLVMFLYSLGHNVKNQVIAHQFGHSEETVSRHFDRVLNAITSLHDILLKAPESQIPTKIYDSTKWYPYFKDCIGAIDGTHIPAWVSLEKQPHFRDWKGNVSQNVLAACSFDEKFIYVLAGWEGSTHDQRMLGDALTRKNKIPLRTGKYYLVDAGFSNRKGFLAPYCSVRYHLNEWSRSNCSPSDKKELFNLRHSSLRATIERVFGVLKARFKILKNKSEYPFKTQTKIVLGCCLLHNHVVNEKKEGDEEVFSDDEDENEVDGGAEIEEDVNMTDVGGEWSDFRDELAQAMWDDYV